MKKLILIIGLIIVMCLLVTVSCAQAPPSEVMPAPMPPPEPAVIPTPAPAPTPSKVPITEEGALVTIPELGQSWATRMIVRTAEIALVVNDVAVALDQVADLAEGFGGYVVSSTRWKEETRLVGIITIRVPAEDFGDAMDALRGLAVDVTHEETSA